MITGAARLAELERQDRENRHAYLNGYIDTMVAHNAMACYPTGHGDNQEGELVHKAANRADLTMDALREMIGDAESFRRAQYAYLAQTVDELASRSIGNVWSEMGACFALSRNGHGAGFFDCGGTLETELQAAARVYGEQSLMIEFDGRVEVL